MDFVWFLLIGAAAGWLAGMIMKGARVRHRCEHHCRRPGCNLGRLDFWITRDHRWRRANRIASHSACRCGGVIVDPQPDQEVLKTMATLRPVA